MKKLVLVDMFDLCQSSKVVIVLWLYNTEKIMKSTWKGWKQKKRVYTRFPTFT
jgi:hypothetical protein